MTVRKTNPAAVVAGLGFARRPPPSVQACGLASLSAATNGSPAATSSCILVVSTVNLQVLWAGSRGAPNLLRGLFSFQSTNFSSSLVVSQAFYGRILVDEQKKYRRFC